MAKWVDFRTVREHLDFTDVLAHYGIKHSGMGDQFKIICPFHDDHKPSCGINRTKQMYHCFACDAGGNALDFVAHMEGFDPDKPKELRKAAMFAAENFGIKQALERPGKGSDKAQGKTDNADAGQGMAKADRSVKAKPKSNGGKVKYPAKPKTKRSQSSSKTVIANDNGEAAAKRETSERPETSENAKPVNVPLTFELKLDPKHDLLSERGFDSKFLAEFGIGYASKGMMKGRVCFPIHNESGELIAYSGRWADGDLPEDVPRYLLPKGFEKARVLFNLHRVLECKTENPDMNTVVIVEGFWSVLRLHGAGVPAVSTFGDNISGAQVELLAAHGFTHAILIYDGDEGGRLGTKSSLPILAERLFAKSISLDDGIKPDTMDDDLIAALPQYPKAVA